MIVFAIKVRQINRKFHYFEEREIFLYSEPPLLSSLATSKDKGFGH